MVDDVEPQRPGGGTVRQRGVRALESGLDHRGLAPWVEGPRGLVRQSAGVGHVASHLPVPSARAGFLNPNLRRCLGAVGVLTCWFARNTRRNVVTKLLDFGVIWR